jgi:hypothetical protein
VGGPGRGRGRMIPVPPAILAAAESTYRLELATRTGRAEAMARAISSALAMQDRHTRADVADMAARMAEDVDDGGLGDLADDGAAALWWLSRAIVETLPQD